MSARLAIIGGGAWGTALAQMLALAGRTVRLYARDEAVVRSIERDRRNERYLPGVTLDPGIEATSDLSQAIERAECVLVVTPTQTLGDVTAATLPFAAPGTPLVLCAKGIERTTGRFPSAVVADAAPGLPVAVLSGPSFAADVARGLPTAVTIASADGGLAGRLAELLSTGTFRCYSTDDVAGVETGAALKNVLAIAAGAASGAGLGASAQAAIVTRGFVELRRLGTVFGARPETLMGLSGLGDLMLTCNSPQSRNFSYGLAIGRAESLDGLALAEGVATAGIAASLAVRHGVDAPIITAVAAILDRRLTIGEAVEALLSRPLKPEDR